MDLILLEYATIIYTDSSSNITPERSLNTLNSELNITRAYKRVYRAALVFRSYLHIKEIER